MRGPVRLGALLSVAVLIAGCAKPRPATVEVRIIRPPEALLLQEGVEIEGLGTEVLRNGGTFRPEKYGRWIAHSSTTRYADLVDRFRTDGYPVRVRVPGREEPLYGLLSFRDLPDGATGPATRAYAISVPQTYVEQATGGRISVVYELVRVSRQQTVRTSAMAKSAPTVRTVNTDWIGWILFLSDRPI